MRKGILLNSQILNALGNMGAQDCITLSNCQMTMPASCHKIDLALKRGTPSLTETLDTLLEEFTYDIVVVPEEIKEHDPELLGALLERIPEEQVRYVSYMQFRKRSERSVAIVRTGEVSRFGCILLEAKGFE